jgi:hypothetical protein
MLKKNVTKGILGLKKIKRNFLMKDFDTIILKYRISEGKANEKQRRNRWGCQK